MAYKICAAFIVFLGMSLTPASANHSAGRAQQMVEGPLRRIRLPIDQLHSGSTGMSAMEAFGQEPEASYTNRQMANTT